MRKYLFCMFILAKFTMVAGQGTGFVRLEGRQFKDENGDDFYPIACTYGFRATYNASGSNQYYLSPNNSYGAGFGCTSPPCLNLDLDFDTQTECTAQIHEELTRISDMGFNTIRTYGIAPLKTDLNKIGVVGFNIIALKNVHPLGSITELIPITPVPFAYSDAGNTNMQLMFDWYDIILQEAESLGLKVLLDLVYDDIAAHNDNVVDYGEFLKAIADRYKNNTTLMAYVVIEEPSYNPRNCGHTKQEICDITTLWYKAIRDIDTNHLITMGGSYVLDALEWDPAVMKVDFYCPHIYPAIEEHESYNLNDVNNRILTNLLWITNNSPMPWVIGETSLSAYDDCPYSTQPLPVIDPPLVDGNIQDQADYGQFILDAVRNTNGSGLTWWNYQEHYWGDQALREDGYGLLRHGGLNYPDIEKPVTQAFRNYPTPPPLPNLINVSDIPNYYNPYNLVPSPYSFTGLITDQATSNGIKDALIFAWTDFYEYPLNDPEFKSGFVFAISNEDGTYTLHTSNPNAITNIFQYPFIINKIAITAASAEKSTYGIWGTQPLPGNNTINCNLNRAPFNFDLIVEDETINLTNSPRNYKGWNKLIVSNSSVLSGGISEIKARKEILVQSDFHAETGSDVHIFCESPIFSDCLIDLDAFSRMHMVTTNYTNSPKSIKEIEIDFLPQTKYAYLELNPNPNSGIFTIEVKSNQSEVSINQIYVFDIIGNVVYNSEINHNLTTLDLSTFARGMYYVQVKNQFSLLTHKIIIE